MSDSVTVRVNRRLNVAVDRVFDAWLNPALAARFLFATRTGNILHCEIEPAIGGSFTVTDRRPVSDGDESFFDAQHRGTYVEIQRPSRLAFDLNVEPYSDAATRVMIDFVPMGVSMSEVVLTHDLGEGADAKANAERTRLGWERMLEQLDKVLTARSWGGFKTPGDVTRSQHNR
jgi:uncharacterized protein YndB with AHSA1/START domain